MEEKKRKGYATKEGQTEATKRYRSTEKGKEIVKHSNYKSTTKKFIRDMASYEELEELEILIQERKTCF